MGGKQFKTSIGIAGPIFALLLAAASAAFAHSREDEEACRPDVLRLCLWAVPSGEQQIVACLMQNKRYLNDACYRVFDREPPRRTNMQVRGEQPWRR